MQKELNKLFTSAKTQIKNDLWPKVKRHLNKGQFDALGDEMEQDLEELRSFLAAQAEGVRKAINKLHSTSAAKHTEKWISMVKASTGIDISAIVTSGELGDLMSVAAVRNARLIRSLSEDIYNRVAGTVLQAVSQGLSVKELQGQLQHQFGVAQSRAKTIARDQTAKLTSNLNRFRQEQAGLDKYVWSTSKDERVRPTHQENEGKTFSWKKPPAETGHPGDDINCRCVAVAIVE